MSTETQTMILDKWTTLQKLKRIAAEIYEKNFGADTVYLAGISGMGLVMAQMLKKELDAAGFPDARVFEVKLDKQAKVQPPIALINAPDSQQIKGQTVVLVDDVINSGRTLSYAMHPFLGMQPARVQVAVMINRHHKRFPVAANYLGYELSTTVFDHVTVILDQPDRIGVYLSSNE